tara:strand:- start:47 stop:193 length:147 start_codon:yes stop_codon:yes gene_type:complete
MTGAAVALVVAGSFFVGYSFYLCYKLGGKQQAHYELKIDAERAFGDEN